MVHPLAGLVAASFSATATNFAPLLPIATSATAAEWETPMAADGVIRVAQLTVNPAPGTGNTVVFTLQKNNVDTACTITISGTNTTGSYNGAPVSWVTGDTLKWKSVPTGSGSPTSAYAAIYLEIETTDGATSIQGIGSSETAWTSVTPNFGPVLGGNNTVTAASSLVACVAPCAGTITGYQMYARGTTNVAATSWGISIFKNGVKQDGSGGTVDTRATLSTASSPTTASASFSLSVAAGDLLFFQADRSGSTPNRIVNFSFCFVAAVPGQAPFQTVTATLSTSVNQFAGWANYNGGALGSVAVTVPHGKWNFSDLYVSLTSAPSAGHSRTFALVKNAVNQSLSVTIADTATTGNDLNQGHKVRIDANDTIRMACNLAGSGTAASIAAIGAVVSAIGGKGAGGGGTGGKGGGGGGVTLQQPGGASYLQYGNQGIEVDIST